MINTEKKKEYKHIVSLGSFCSPALELERFGYRDSSYPFDWLITRSFQEVIKLIKTYFEGWLSYDDLFQWTKERNIYEDPVISIVYVHDFNKNIPLYEQIRRVQDKYHRRILRFYEYIQEPTLFIRYIHPIETMEYVEKNYDEILNCLRKFNAENDIVFFANKETIGLEKSDRINVYPLDPDDGDVVARRFFEQEKHFVDLLKYSYSAELRESNLRVLHKKIKENKQKKLIKKLKSFSDKIAKKEYEHDNSYRYA